jgi:hypothetical protein
MYADHYFFLWTVQPTKIIMDTVYRLLTKNNDYTIHKKVGLNFFDRKRWTDHYFFYFEREVLSPILFIWALAGFQRNRSFGVPSFNFIKQKNIIIKWWDIVKVVDLTRQWYIYRVVLFITLGDDHPLKNSLLKYQSFYIFLSMLLIYIYIYMQYIYNIYILSIRLDVVEVA